MNVLRGSRNILCMLKILRADEGSLLKLMNVKAATTGGESLKVVPYSSSVRQTRLLDKCCSAANTSLLNNNTRNFVFQTVRQKSKKPSKEQDEDSDGYEDEIADEEDGSVKDYTDVSTNVASLRVDSILKGGLGISRSKVEVLFYQSRLRLNGSKVLKKSADLNVGDEVDLIKGTNSLNPAFLDISRVVLRGVKHAPGQEKINVKLRRFKTITVDNYEEPWSAPSGTNN